VREHEALGIIKALANGVDQSAMKFFQRTVHYQNAQITIESQLTKIRENRKLSKENIEW